MLPGREDARPDPRHLSHALVCMYNQYPVKLPSDRFP